MDLKSLEAARKLQDARAELERLLRCVAVAEADEVTWISAVSRRGQRVLEMKVTDVAASTLIAVLRSSLEQQLRENAKQLEELGVTV